ncbi:MAG TPA: DUF3048 domain-containing protein [Acidimicrobiales bacterium]
MLRRWLDSFLRWWAGLTRQQQVIAGLGAAIGVVVLGIGAALAAGSGGGHKAAVTTTTVATTTTTTAPKATTTTAPPTGPVAPLTGLHVSDPTVLFRPAMAVKIDNLDAPHETAVPQKGLNQADIVFEEVVEGNITRLVGVFQSQAPDPVGPVRSLRTTDVHLLPQLSHPLVVFSGGNQGVLAASLTADFVVRSEDAVPSAFFRDHSRRAPHNLYVHPAQVWSSLPPGQRLPAPLFTYLAAGEPRPAGASAASGVDLTWGGGAASSPVSWRWDPATKQYLRTQNGRPHMDADSNTQLSATNVVVLATTYGQSPADLRSPEANSVGSGEAWVLSGGVVVHGTWNRPTEQSPPVLTDSSGQPIKLTPGRTWIELPKAGGATIVN